jgi:hypothetical protein
VIFQITKTTYPDSVVLDRADGTHHAIPAHTNAEWALVKASGEVICRGPHIFYGPDAEKKARSQIAEAKRAFAGARRCKVEVIER